VKAVLDPGIPAHVAVLQRIDTYAEIEEIMKSEDFAMAGGEERDIFLGDTMTNSEGRRHSELKQLFSPLMSRQAIAYYETNLVQPAIASSLADLEMVRGQDGFGRADVVPILQAALTRIAALVTGVDGVDTAQRTERFRSLVWTLSAATTATFTDDPAASVASGREALDALVAEFLEASLARRVELVGRFTAGEVEKADLPRDVFTSLALADDLSRDDDGLKIPYVWRQAAAFLTASIKTTSHSMPHVVVHIDEWVTEHPEDRDKLTDPEFLHRALAESLRLHQTSPARFRRALRDVTLSTGRTVAQGEMVALHAPVANVSEEVFGADGRYFNPRREVPNGMPDWGMTFGLGVHSCIGKNLVTGMMNKVDAKYGTHGTAVRLLLALYDLGAELDPENPPTHPSGTFHDTWESVPVVLTKA
jgi:cytochrome P450